MKTPEDGPLQKRYLPIAIITGLLCLVAIVGYSLPQKEKGRPVRLLLDNKGGKVIFTHASHNETMSEDCGLCHHYTADTKHPPKCSVCHLKKFNDNFKKTHQQTMDKKVCGSCHHAESTIALFDHAAHIEDYVPDDCQACHHDPSIEPVAQACSHCHEQPGDEEIPSLMKASHDKCIQCHEDLFMEGSEGCQKCHARNPIKEEIKHVACSKCHEEPLEELIPTTTTAFHTQCQTCHDYSGAGPYGEDACYQCHMQ